MEIGSYITGFVDGEGSFLVSFSMREKMSIGIEARPSFTVSQHERSAEVLKMLLRHFACGSLRHNRSDQTVKYEVRSLKDLIERIIPHFESFPLQTSKRNDYEHIKKICFLMQKKAHLNIEGIRMIIDNAYRMNNLGARRIGKNDLLKVVSKMKV